jgi:hypothetical protein
MVQSFMSLTFYFDASGPLCGNVPEAVVVHFHSLAGEDQIQQLFNGYC